MSQIKYFPIFLVTIALLIVLGSCEKDSVEVVDPESIIFTVHRIPNETAEQWTFLIDSRGHSTSTKEISLSSEVTFKASELSTPEEFDVFVISRNVIEYDGKTINYYTLLAYQSFFLPGQSFAYSLPELTPVGSVEFSINLENEVPHWGFESSYSSYGGSGLNFEGSIGLHDDPGFAYFQMRQEGREGAYYLALNDLSSGSKLDIKQGDFKPCENSISSGTGDDFTLSIEGVRNGIRYYVEEDGNWLEEKKTLYYPSGVFDKFAYSYWSNESESVSYNMSGISEEIPSYTKPDFRFNLINKETLKDFEFSAENFDSFDLYGRSVFSENTTFDFGFSRGNSYSRTWNSDSLSRKLSTLMEVELSVDTLKPTSIKLFDYTKKENLFDFSSTEDFQILLQEISF